MNRIRGGFTLIELLVVTVLGALVVMASLQVLVTNQRTYTAQMATIQGQQTVRAAMDVLWGELREVSSRGGDILSIRPDSLTVRVMRKFGIACEVDTSGTGQPRLKAVRIGPAFVAGDSSWVFADNDQSRENDDRWIRSQITQVDTAAVLCGTRPAQRVVFAGQRAAFTADSVRVGAPVRSHLTYTYGPVAFNGQIYLGRTAPGQRPVPIVGPLASTGGLSFSYRDSLGAVTTNRMLVRQIVVTLRTGGVVNSWGGPVTDSIVTWIYTRN